MHGWNGVSCRSSLSKQGYDASRVVMNDSAILLWQKKHIRKAGLVLNYLHIYVASLLSAAKGELPCHSNSL